MSRQHCVPVLLGSGTAGTTPLTLLGQGGGPDAVSEADIQALIHAHPSILPIAEIDPMFVGAMSACTELSTPAGPIDNLLITPSGLPVIVECKLWRNPEARREVVGQVLDYAKELSRWSSADLQREVSRRLGRTGNALLDLVRLVDSTVDELEFNDALTANLRRGRFLLLIVGDGIREGVEAIAEYLQAHAGLHFSLGLVELPIYLLPDGSRLVAPRVLARTLVVTRTVVALSEGYALHDAAESSLESELDPDRRAAADDSLRFWTEFLAGLRLDDPEQPRAKPTRRSNIIFSLPAPARSSWLSVYRMQRNEVGVFLSSSRNTAGEYAMQAIADDWDAVRDQLGGTARLGGKEGRPEIVDSSSFGPLEQDEVRARAFAWLGERVNAFVNVMRPRVRSAVANYLARSE